MRAFIINLDSAPDRWAFIEASFAGSRLHLTRIPAIDGRTLRFPHPAYSRRLYRWFHGRSPNVRELACYLSHLKAMETFLATEETHALIGEDDLVLRPDFDAVLEAALPYAHTWNILRLTALGPGHPCRVLPLHGAYSLAVTLGRLKGTGAYLLDRTAAQACLARLLPMRLPYDHALDREWTMGLRAAAITPFPAAQDESRFLSTVQPGIYPKLSPARRSLTTYPYQACNELARWLYRGTRYLSLRARQSRGPRKRD